MECRTCLKKTGELQELFEDDLPHKIETISSIQIFRDDRFPSKICYDCVGNVRLLYDFRSIVRKSNMILESRLVNDVTIDNTEPESIFLNTEVFVVEDVKKPSCSKRKTYECQYCDFKDSHYNAFRSHRRTHKDQEGLRTLCNICGKLVTTDNLGKHISSHAETPVNCEICGKVVKNRESLRGHMYLHKDIQLNCPHCDQVYHSRTAYFLHLRRHKNGFTKTVGCSLCGKYFFDKKTLVKHIRSHTGERPYPCEFCQKGFSSPYALKTHKRQHTNERPFACNHCDMAFLQRVSLKTHMRSKHPDEVENKESSNPGAPNL